MSITRAEVEFPEEILFSLKEKKDAFVGQMKLYTAMKLFEMGKLSLGKAAVLAGYKKWDFIHLLGQHKISVFNYEQSEIEKDVKTLKKLLKEKSKS